MEDLMTPPGPRGRDVPRLKQFPARQPQGPEEGAVRTAGPLGGEGSGVSASRRHIGGPTLSCCLCASGKPRLREET